MAAQTAPQAPDLNLLQAIEMVAKEKGIDRLRLVKTIEEAILKAAQSVFGPNRELEAAAHAFARGSAVRGGAIRRPREREF